MHAFQQRLQADRTATTAEGLLFEAHPSKLESNVNMELALVQSEFLQHGDQSRCEPYLCYSSLSHRLHVPCHHVPYHHVPCSQSRGMAPSSN